MNSTAKILIVDDNAAIHEILEKLFITGNDTDFLRPVVLHADNGLDALEMLLINPDVDVIVLDLDMPVMNGFETLAHIKGDLRFKAIPVCVFTASKDDSIKALKLGASDFMSKQGDYLEIKLRVWNLIEHKRQAEASERAKIDFLANVSHELRTPMNGVIGGMQLLQMTEMTDEQLDYVEIVDQSTRRMMDMIESVLSFLKSENPLHYLPVMPFSLRTIVQETIDGLKTEAEHNGITPMVDIHPDITDNLTGLPDKIQLIFQHLLSNAIKFSPSGRVAVRVEPGVRDEKSVQLRCSVTDTGIGIPAEIQACIFEPFTQADGSKTRKFGGLGIGLSIAGRMVKLMGGSLNVESSQGGGSTFSFAVSCGIDGAGA